MLPMLSIVGLYFLDGKISTTYFHQKLQSDKSLGVVEGQEISIVQEKVILLKLLDKFRHFFTSLCLCLCGTCHLCWVSGS